MGGNLIIIEVICCVLIEQILEEQRCFSCSEPVTPCVHICSPLQESGIGILDALAFLRVLEVVGHDNDIGRFAAVWHLETLTCRYIFNGDTSQILFNGLGGWDIIHLDRLCRLSGYSVDERLLRNAKNAVDFSFIEGGTVHSM